jgi:hypothetical protein
MRYVYFTIKGIAVIFLIAALIVFNVFLISLYIVWNFGFPSWDKIKMVNEVECYTYDEYTERSGSEYFKTFVHRVFNYKPYLKSINRIK